MQCEILYTNIREDGTLDEVPFYDLPLKSGAKHEFLNMGEGDGRQDIKPIEMPAFVWRFDNNAMLLQCFCNVQSALKSGFIINIHHNNKFLNYTANIAVWRIESTGEIKKAKCAASLSKEDGSLREILYTNIREDGTLDEVPFYDLPLKHQVISELIMKEFSLAEKAFLIYGINRIPCFTPDCIFKFITQRNSKHRF